MGTIAADARRFAELFPALYLRFCRRRRERALSAQSWAVLQHLALSGPLTVTEAALHFERAQSVMSEIVEHLIDKDLLCRQRDEHDRRRSLIWLSDNALSLMSEERQVLDPALVKRAMAGLRATEREALLKIIAKLVDTSSTKEKES